MSDKFVCDFFTYCFICADVYDLPESFSGKFDLVYTEGGILTWLPDMRAYARSVVRCLKPGGIFYIRDSHPFRRVIFPAVLDGRGELRYYHYFSQDPTCMDMRGSYAQPDADTHHTVYFWVHGIGEIVTELSNAGLHIEFLVSAPNRWDAPLIEIGPCEYPRCLYTAERRPSGDPHEPIDTDDSED